LNSQGRGKTAVFQMKHTLCLVVVQIFGFEVQDHGSRFFGEIRQKGELSVLIEEDRPALLRFITKPPVETTEIRHSILSGRIPSDNARNLKFISIESAVFGRIHTQIWSRFERWSG
jgi:hypothetical protein